MSISCPPVYDVYTGVADGDHSLRSLGKVSPYIVAIYYVILAPCVQGSFLLHKRQQLMSSAMYPAIVTVAAPEPWNFAEAG